MMWKMFAPTGKETGWPCWEPSCRRGPPFLVEIPCLALGKDDIDRECSNSLLLLLPDELVLLIVSFLDIVASSSFGNTCKKAFALANDELLWKDRLDTARHKWKVYSNCHCSVGHGSMLMSSWVFAATEAALWNSLRERFRRWSTAWAGAGVVADSQMPLLLLSSKREYMVQHAENAKLGRASTSPYVAAHHDDDRGAGFGTASIGSAHTWPGLLFNTLKTKPFTVGMFGSAVSAHKRLVYNMMWSESRPFKVIGMQPGSGGQGSGVVFRVAGADVNLSAMHSFIDRETLEKVPVPLHRVVNGMLLVVHLDKSGSLEYARTSVDLLLERCPAVPLLVIVAAKGRRLVHAYDICSALGLVDLSSHSTSWRVQEANIGEELTGIEAGLSWLSARMQASSTG